MKVLRFAEKVLPLLFWLFLIFAFDTAHFAIMTLISAVIHETGHILFGLSRGIIRILPSPVTSGFRINPERALSYKDELILTLGGPLLNLITAFVFAIFSVFLPLRGYTFLFAIVNLLTALSNLLPIKAYDGYTILESTLLLIFKNSERVIRGMSILSFTFTVLLMFLSLYLMLKIGEGYWIFAVFFSSFIAELTKIHKNGIF